MTFQGSHFYFVPRGSGTRTAYTTHLVYGVLRLQKPHIALQQVPNHARLDEFPKQQQQRAAKETEQGRQEHPESVERLDHHSEFCEHFVERERGRCGVQVVRDHGSHASRNNEAGHA